MGWMRLFEDALFNAPGKLATIWFDSLVLQTPGTDLLPKVLDSLIEKRQLSAASRDELLKIWLPASRVVPQYKFMENPWEGAEKNVIDQALSVTVAAAKAQYPGVDEDSPEFRHEVAMAGGGLLDSIRLWSSLNAEGGCTLLAHEREGAVVKQAFAQNDESGIDLFSEVAAERMPSLDNLSWDRVLELRAHPHLERFRKKLAQVQVSARAGDLKASKEMVADLELRELRQLAQAVEPSPGAAVVRAICSNLPLPVPFNPASIALGIDDVADNVDRTVRYGWLYFLMEF